MFIINVRVGVERVIQGEKATNRFLFLPIPHIFQNIFKKFGTNITRQPDMGKYPMNIFAAMTFERIRRRK
jgi:hypothetical protein